MDQIPQSDLPLPDPKRIFKLKTKLQPHLSSFTQPHSNHFPKQYIPIAHLHVPGKINFHELLSIPLEKEIQRENSLKTNQTFSLKFQPDFSQRQPNKHHSKQSLNKFPYKNTRFLNRKNLITQKGTRISKILQDSEFAEIKQATKTMYFKPIGKIARNYENENHERKSLQIARNIKNKSGQKFEFGVSVSKDKLLMLLQIRKQERNERNERNSKSALGGSFNNNLQGSKFLGTDEVREKLEQSKSNRSYRKRAREEPRIPSLRREKKEHKETEDGVNPSMLSPWYLMENGEDF